VTDRWIIVEDGYLRTDGCGCCAGEKSIEDATAEDIVELTEHLNAQIRKAAELLGCLTSKKINGEQ
jgi:hypothetical protein